MKPFFKTFLFFFIFACINAFPNYLVTNIGANTIAIVDAATNDVIGTVNDTVAPLSGPGLVSITPDGTKAFVGVTIQVPTYLAVA